MTIRQGGQAAATGGSAFGYSLLGTGQVETELDTHEYLQLKSYNKKILTFKVPYILKIIRTLKTGVISFKKIRLEVPYW